MAHAVEAGIYAFIIGLAGGWLVTKLVILVTAAL